MRPIAAIIASADAVIVVGAAVLIVVSSRPRDHTSHPDLALAAPIDELEPRLVPQPVREAPAPRDPRITEFVVGRCLLTVEISGRIVYRGKPRCANKPHTIAFPIPRERAALVHTRSASYYANGDIWGEQDDTFLVPLAATRYVLGEGYAFVDGATDPGVHGTHCVVVRANRRDAVWYVHHFGERFGPFDLGDAHATGGTYNAHSIYIADRRVRHRDLLVRYLRTLPGTYTFTVQRHRVTLAYDSIDHCGSPLANAS